MATELVFPKDSSFATIGDRQLAKRGYSINALNEHLHAHLIRPTDFNGKIWCDVRCGAKTFFGRDSRENRIRIRIRFGRATSGLLKRGLLLLKDYESKSSNHSLILAVKLYDPQRPEDTTFALRQLTIANLNGELTYKKLKQIKEIIGLDEREKQDSGESDGGAAATV